METIKRTKKIVKKNHLKAIGLQETKIKKVFFVFSSMVQTPPKRTFHKQEKLCCLTYLLAN